MDRRREAGAEVKQGRTGAGDLPEAGPAVWGAEAKERGAVLVGELKALPEGEAAQVPPLRQCSQHWSSSHLSPV